MRRYKQAINGKQGRVLRPQGNIDEGCDQHKGQHKQAEYNQGALEKLDPPSGIFQGLAIDMHAAPDMLSHIGFRPEPVNCKGHNVQ